MRLFGTEKTLNGPKYGFKAKSYKKYTDMKDVVRIFDFFPSVPHVFLFTVCMMYFAHAH